MTLSKEVWCNLWVLWNCWPKRGQRRCRIWFRQNFSHNILVTTNGFVRAMQIIYGHGKSLGKVFMPPRWFYSPTLQTVKPKESMAMGTRTREQFCASRRVASQPKVLALYQPERNLKFLADASSHGLGAVLLQNTVNAWRPVAYAPRTLSEPEKS